MDDLVKRLLDQGYDAFAKQYSLGMWKLCAEAAVEIERLQRLAKDFEEKWNAASEAAHRRGEAYRSMEKDRDKLALKINLMKISDKQQ